MAGVLSSSFCRPVPGSSKRGLSRKFSGVGRIEFAMPRLYN